MKIQWNSSESNDFKILILLVKDNVSDKSFASRNWEYQQYDGKVSLTVKTEERTIVIVVKKGKYSNICSLQPQNMGINARLLFLRLRKKLNFRWGWKKYNALVDLVGFDNLC